MPDPAPALVRHGDVLVAAIDALPAAATPRPGNVLAHGEITGHSHRFVPAEGGSLLVEGGQLYLRVTGTVTLTHEEHGPIRLEPGLYRVWRQREYTPEAVRTVMD